MSEKHAPMDYLARRMLQALNLVEVILTELVSDIYVKTKLSKENRVVLE